MSWTRRFDHHVAVLQAAALLMGAQLLVAALPMRYWRGSLGAIRGGSGGEAPSGPAAWADVPPGLRRIVGAVERAALRLPLHLRCLPRAMAVQWMARRHGYDCTLRIGIEQGGERELHAWIDCGQVTIIGEIPDRLFAQILAIRSWDPAR